MNHHRLLEKVDEVKGKLTDKEYKDIVEEINPQSKNVQKMYKLTCVYPTVSPTTCVTHSHVNVGNDYQTRIIYHPFFAIDVDFIKKQIEDFGMCTINDFLTHGLDQNFSCNDEDEGHEIRIQVKPSVVRIEEYKPLQSS